MSLLAGSALLLLAGSGAWHLAEPTATAETPPATPPGVPVIAGVARQQDVPIYLTGLGTVQAYNTVTIHTRVDGELTKVAFKEGQDVKAGDLLAQIDPRPFQATLDQATAKKTQDEAQLENAKRDLQRYAELGTKDFISRQTVDTQKSLVAQLTATIAADQAAIDSAQVQLGYTTITSPLAGRTGIRLVDQGNIVHATDATGLVVITQLQPISVIFTLPEEDFIPINQELRQGSLKVIAYSQDDRTKLDEGTLALVDNQIDQTTGTIKLKANFPNPQHTLWPGEFVNAHLLLNVRHDAVTVAAPVVQRGPQGTFAYVIKPDATVEARPIKVAQIADNVALIDSGLEAGDRVVVDGQYKLQPGTRVAAAGSPSAVDAGEGLP
ncbi:MAG TPA: efflux RND transporter periplasmic adaptor subunit [Stellaceae bacterium]|nr:efflux RND transporter periplasmic adaptor subunit [Stellaceae bacterium]